MSPSPSAGYQDYTRGDYAVLPTNNADLETLYSAQDVLDVAEVDTAWVAQSATNEYAIHQFKDFATANTCFIQWTGKTDTPSSVTYLQVYNVNSATWETVDSVPATYNMSTGTYASTRVYYGNQTADTDFTMVTSISDLTNYKDAQGIVTCRVYQLDP